MANTIIIQNRLNWIDWAKVIAITFVVFGHTPQEPGSFPQSYIVTFHMPLFMFISGFLTKKEYFNIATLKKYWHTLIIPYFCYNLVFYPYWVLRHVIENPYSDWLDYCKPLLGMLMFQCETEYSEILNGVTWFLLALLVYKIILSICNKYKHGNRIIVSLMIASAVFYPVNEIHLFTSDLAPINIAKCLPFFYLGYFCKQKGLMADQPHPKDKYLCVACLCISLVGYMTFVDKSNTTLFALRFWLISVTGTLGILSLSKLLDSIHSTIIDNISIGTIVIMGIHFMLIGTTNFILEKALHLEGKIIYAWYVALILDLLFETMLYPLIILFKNRLPFMLGKWKAVKSA